MTSFRDHCSMTSIIFTLPTITYVIDFPKSQTALISLSFDYNQLKVVWVVIHTFLFLEMVHIFSSLNTYKTIPVLMYGLLILYENHYR